MVVKSSGTSLSFSEIRTEFGNGDNSLGQYRRDDNRFGNKDLGDLEDLPLDTGVPTSGAIKFSDFYGKQLNVVIDCHRTGNNTYNHDAYTDRFLNGNYDIVGNFKSSISKSQWQGGKKVIIHINKHFGSEGATNRNQVAFNMGTYNNNVNQSGWPNSTTLTLDVGDEGLVGGRGGKGGDAGNEEAVGESGGTGTSGMKIHSGFQDEISGESRIFGGGGGGGSGSGSEQNNWWDKNSAGGGGGGGGTGLPAGIDGTANGPGATEDPQGGGVNTAPSSSTGGDGGRGGDNEEAEGGNGGNGGGRNSSGGNASGGKNLAGDNESGGTAGHQYRFY
tara:strand:- start:1132 stop:2127 length:996 start_codon:yes stop_codon:yes gene_type:complete